MTYPRLSLIALLVSFAAHADADIFEPLGPSQSDFGGVGLLQMPTARMAKTGEFSANYVDDDQYRRWSMSVQPFDWLEATLRYTDVRTRLYSANSGFSGDQTYKDKGMDVKARLWNESTWRPHVSVGLRDVMGTGLFDSEYIVASKRYKNLDFTLGMAWGNMGQSGNIKNPSVKPVRPGASATAVSLAVVANLNLAACSMDLPHSLAGSSTRRLGNH